MLFLAFLAAGWAQSKSGYYRYPAIHGSQVVFTSEGDLWVVGIEGGPARRLTCHPGEEAHAAFSPDGMTIAYSADYEGPTEVYTTPAEGGLPIRRTFDGGVAIVAGWTLDGKILYSTRSFATLPITNSPPSTLRTGSNSCLSARPQRGVSIHPYGKTLFFTRQRFQGSQGQAVSGRHRRISGNSPPARKPCP